MPSGLSEKLAPFADALDTCPPWLVAADLIASSRHVINSWRFDSEVSPNLRRTLIHEDAILLIGVISTQESPADYGEALGDVMSGML